MDFCELDLKQLIEVKLIRLNKPKFNLSNTPYFGEYIEDFFTMDSNSDISLLSNELLLKNFNLSEIVPIGNMMMINSSFGKVLFGESLEACIFVLNLSKTDDMRIKEIKVVVTNDELPNYSSVYKKCEFVVFEVNNIVIPCGKFYSSKISFIADNISRYTISTDIQYSCTSFNNEYIKNSQGKIIKTMSTGYYIEQNKGQVVRKYQKKMLFDNNLPFKIKEKVITTNLGKTFIEINLVNNTNSTLHISEFSLLINKNTLNLEKNSFDNLIKPLCQDEEISLESEDEYNFVYQIDDFSAVQLIENFTFRVNWFNLFDSIQKQLVFIIKNKLLNEFVGISIYQSPEKFNIFINEIFLIKILFTNIHKSKSHILLIFI
jgi:hypothetical protein